MPIAVQATPLTMTNRTLLPLHFALRTQTLTCRYVRRSIRALDALDLEDDVERRRQQERQPPRQLHRHAAARRAGRPPRCAAERRWFSLPLIAPLRRITAPKMSQTQRKDA